MKALTPRGKVFVLALYAAGLLGCLALLWVGAGATTDGPATATATATADSRPQTATPTATVTAKAPTLAPTHTPNPTATATPVTAGTGTGTRPYVSGTETATATPAAATLVPTATPALECRAGVITAHAAIEAVLANRPERRCAGCIYFASVLCQELGKVFTLKVKGETLTVTAVDCADWSVGKWPQKSGQDWLGELDIRSWPEGEPLAPLEAKLCEVR